MNVYEIITGRIIEALESGSCPWRKSWNAAPANISGRPYRGINAFILGAAGFRSPFFLTYRQAQERGGFVRKGERGLPVVLWKWIQERDENGKPSGRSIPFLRYFTVFNVEQCEGIVAPAVAEAPADPIAAAEAILAGMPQGAEIRHGGDLACYSPTLDVVTVPARETFRAPAAYYSTLFHELTHSTGHATRLGRPGIVDAHAFASHEYSREELVAEMGAAFLCAESGILPATITDSAAYLRSWIRALRGDSRLVVIAAAQAQKAADWILKRDRGAAAVEEVAA